jgi:hypothetical protein
MGINARYELKIRKYKYICIEKSDNITSVTDLKGSVIYTFPFTDEETELQRVLPNVSERSKFVPKTNGSVPFHIADHKYLS